MSLKRNLGESLKTLKENKLRSFLTIFIITLGITALIGIITTIVALQESLGASFQSLGANTFTIEAASTSGRTSGKISKAYREISLKEALLFKKLSSLPEDAVSVTSRLTSTAELKSSTEKSDPNARVYAVDHNYVRIKTLNVIKGRNFMSLDINQGASLALIGKELASTLFKKDKDVIGSYVFYKSERFRIIGLLEETGGAFGGSGYDRALIIPYTFARKLSEEKPDFTLICEIKDVKTVEDEMIRSEGVMRQIRGDKPTDASSVEIEKSDSLISTLDEISSGFKIGGLIIGLITLSGAAIALMNIMLVSVTERTREFGLRKSLGATPKAIRNQVLWEAVFICILGGVSGILLGLILGNILATVMGSDTFVFPYGWVMIGLIMCTVTGLSSGIFPANKASKLDPVEALRFE